METVEVIYKIKTAVANEIVAHLIECDNNFYPLLTERVDIEEYSRKIFEKAVTFEAWIGNVLVGLLAVYFSDNSSRSAFITNVSVMKNYLGSGIASKLLGECIEYAVRENFNEIILDVNKENTRAISLYRKFDFKFDGIAENFLKMKMELIVR